VPEQQAARRLLSNILKHPDAIQLYVPYLLRDAMQPAALLSIYDKFEYFMLQPQDFCIYQDKITTSMLDVQRNYASCRHSFVKTFNGCTVTMKINVLTTSKDSSSRILARPVSENLTTRHILYSLHATQYILQDRWQRMKAMESLHFLPKPFLLVIISKRCILMATSSM
jgi:hypothetical protein